MHYNSLDFFEFGSVAFGPFLSFGAHYLVFSFSAPLIFPNFGPGEIAPGRDITDTLLLTCSNFWGSIYILNEDNIVSQYRTNLPNSLRKSYSLIRVRVVKQAATTTLTFFSEGYVILGMFPAYTYRFIVQEYGVFNLSTRTC